MKLKASVLLMLNFSIALLACTEQQELPLEEWKLVKILCDIHIAEAALKDLKATEKAEAAETLYEQVYALHQVDQAIVDSSLYILKRTPKVMEKVYAEVMEELKRMELENE